MRDGDTGIRTSDELTHAVWDAIDEDLLVELVCGMIDIPSPTSEEKPLAEYYARFLGNHGLESYVQTVSDNCANGVGVLRGHRGGPKILFSGHLDTTFTGVVEEDFAATATPGAALAPKAFVKDGAVYGLGAWNMKGGVAAMTIAVLALHRAGVNLAGDVVVAGVGGAIEKTPVRAMFKNYAGSYYEGAGVGTRYLLKHGVFPDYHVISEATDLRVRKSCMGFLNLKLTVTGRMMYAPWKGDTEPNSATVNLSRVVLAIEEDFRRQYAERHRHDEGDFGVLVPTVNVGSVESGWPFKPAFVPAIAYAYVDMRVVPGQSPNDAIEELGAFLRTSERARGIETSIEPYLIAAPGGETPQSSPLVGACTAAYEYVAGRAHHPPATGLLGQGDDSVFVRQYGIHSVTWGPGGYGDENFGALGECMKIDEMVTAARMYTRAVLTLNGM